MYLPSQFRVDTRDRKPKTPTLLPATRCEDPLCSSPFRNAPPELRGMIMSMLELNELIALACTCSVFYDQYLLDRRFLLPQSLQRTLKSATVDACTAYQSGLREVTNIRTEESVLRALESYHNRRSTDPFSIHPANLSEKDILNIVAFHIRVVQPVAKYYASKMLAKIVSETAKPRSREPLSSTEEIRVFRALYRFQIACNSFGPSDPQDVPFFMEANILESFVLPFKPWEVEEIICIYGFAESFYAPIFYEIVPDLDKNKGKSDRLHEPTTGIDDPRLRDVYLRGTIARGLELFHTVLCTIKDHKHLVSTVAKERSPAACFLDYPLRYFQEPSEQRKRLPFQGDGSSDGNRLLPPLAWTLIWGGFESNKSGAVQNKPFRKWAYVMWDALRLERTGAQRLLVQH